MQEGRSKSTFRMVRRLSRASVPPSRKPATESLKCPVTERSVRIRANPRRCGAAAEAVGAGDIQDVMLIGRGGGCPRVEILTLQAVPLAA